LGPLNKRKMLAAATFNDQKTLSEADGSALVFLGLNKFPANKMLRFPLAAIAKEALYFLGSHLEKPSPIRESVSGIGQ